jgi:sugar transferase (PEP-CTERM system associated)
VATARIFNHHLHIAFYRLILVDALLFFGSFYVGAYLYFLPEPQGFAEYVTKVHFRAITFSIIGIGSLVAMGLYQPRMREGTSGILLRTAGAFVLIILAMSVIFYVLPDLHLWRGIFLYTITVAFIACLSSRLAFTKLTNREQLKSRVLVYGAGQAASTITTAMRRKSDRQGFIIVGFVRVGNETVRVGDQNLLEPDGPLQDYTQRMEIDRIVVALDDKRARTPADEMVECRLNGVEIVDLINFFEQEAGKILVDFVGPGWLVYSNGFNSSTASKIAKRCFDIFTSFLLLMATWPIMLATVAAIWLEDGFGAPLVFRQNRVGQRGKIFQVLKFRSMTVDAEGDGKARWATANDSRVTRVGQFIRRVRIDELPQIINVLAGEMAFIGPRPERPEFVEELAEQIPYFDIRHGVKPGITGWAQLCYPYGASVDDSRQKLQFDLYYVKNHSLFLDFMILLTTVEVVLFGKGAR